MDTSFKKKSNLVLHLFLNQKEKSQRARLLSFLPEREREELERLTIETKSVDVDLFSDVHILEKVHWSWLLPILKNYQESEQKLFISALDPYAEKNLVKNLTLSPTSIDTSEIGRSFLRKQLTQELLQEKKDLLPCPYLPPSPLNALLLLSKKKMTSLIDRLSLYDLALEIKQLVETKVLKKLYALLSSEEKNLLQEIGNQKEFHFLGKIGLDRWDGTEESLRTLLHKKGLSRLGAALSHEHSDLIWYVCHVLDVGRGIYLQKQCIKESIKPQVSKGITKQIEREL